MCVQEPEEARYLRFLIRASVSCPVRVLGPLGKPSVLSFYFFFRFGSYSDIIVCVREKCSSNLLECL